MVAIDTSGHDPARRNAHAMEPSTLAAFAALCLGAGSVGVAEEELKELHKEEHGVDST